MTVIKIVSQHGIMLEHKIPSGTTSKGQPTDKRIIIKEWIPNERLWWTTPQCTTETTINHIEWKWYHRRPFGFNHESEVVSNQTTSQNSEPLAVTR